MTTTTNLDYSNNQKWADLLVQAVSQPGLILKAYSAFWGYSLGNKIAALMQCQIRSLTPGPIDTFKGWLEKGRAVRKGEKALWLCMPLTRKRKNEDTGEDELFITTFVWKPRWFCLSQTDGEPIPMLEIPAWNKDRALAALNLQEVLFTHVDGNVQGYATQQNQIAISPLAVLPHKTCFHECAHAILHADESSISDSEHTPKSLREVEAESVALLLCESLELPGADFCRGYIQGWLEGDSIPEKSAQRIFGAADRILKAGLIQSSAESVAA